MSNKIKLGFVGGGNDSLIGVLHKVAAVMFDRYHLVGGVFSSNKDVNVKTADDLGLDQSRIYNDFEEMIDAESKVDLSEKIEAVCILTPNFLHFPMAKKFLENGFHVIVHEKLHDDDGGDVEDAGAPARHQSKRSKPSRRFEDGFLFTSRRRNDGDTGTASVDSLLTRCRRHQRFVGFRFPLVSHA